MWCVTSPPRTTSPSSGLDEHALVSRRVARRGEHRDPVEEVGVPVELAVVGAVEARPLDEVVRLRDRCELGPLDVGGQTGEAAIPAAVVEVKVRVDHDLDTGHVRPGQQPVSATRRRARAWTRSFPCRRGRGRRRARHRPATCRLRLRPRCRGDARGGCPLSSAHGRSLPRRAVSVPGVDSAAPMALFRRAPRTQPAPRRALPPPGVIRRDAGSSSARARTGCATSAA